MRRQMQAGWIASVLAAGAVVGCSGGGSGVTTPSTDTKLVTVSPAGGSTGVSVTAPMSMTFSGPMQTGMEQYIDLHHGDATGPVVPMTCTWSADRERVTCMPTAPLNPHAGYTLHMGGGMMDADGHRVDMQRHQAQTGGQWLMPGMMGGMHAGTPMSGMSGGWKGANGSYGMLFPFTTN